MHLLGDLSVAVFLRDYWQKKPVVIRQAWPGFQPLLAADELAGLSLESEIESRLVMENGPAGPWEIRKGPFDEAAFADLPDSHWTLLVQAVDHWIPEAADLLEHFRFLPGWRVDDLMISYAVDGGSVGPHYDQYDVFLLQAEGQREWRIGQMCNDESPIIQGPMIRVLAGFEETDRWVLDPGDMLYLPPQLAHYGIAWGECQTYSIGFRAPSVAELAQSALDQVLSNSSEDQRYTDADYTAQEGNPGEISAAAKTRLAKLLQDMLMQPDHLGDILGTLMTEPKYPEHQSERLNDDDWEAWRSQHRQLPDLRKSEHARFAYQKTASGLVFYAQGKTSVLDNDDLELAQLLSSRNQYPREQMADVPCSRQGYELLRHLWLQQLIYQVE
ncbi:cupin domain-containing protein [Oceanobacter sp. 5_MG-2023]|uniref:cupin domain-containing protein n=1 Tax=Oceanobacter sp. 5_MG-2023 TaxID=3062645 RepID=UPI0026E1827F|nr:cupin domain-containing protein [Oceanobacter sp. 5_MG-2023]MDO6683283.1 cupin domain-containing protein [Oceanobacter sp. 5_MG-2023]